MKRWIHGIVLGLLVGLSAQSLAYDRDGHRVVAMISFSYLNDAAKQELERLLGSNYRQEWIGSSYWAAEESEKVGNEWMQALHRVWFDPEDQGFDQDKHCPRNRCVVGAILESRHVLEQNGYSQQEKRQAFKFLLHFVADIHQPTNCGFRRDQSGQKIWLKSPDLTNVNLHWIWQTAMLKKQEKRWSTLAIELVRDMPQDEVVMWTENLDPVAWAWECHQIARETAYLLALDKKWGNQYYKEAWPVYEQQLQKAGIRLATMINEIYPSS
jgi:hypothetical protein